MHRDEVDGALSHAFTPMQQDGAPFLPSLFFGLRTQPQNDTQGIWSCHVNVSMAQ